MLYFDEYDDWPVICRLILISLLFRGKAQVQGIEISKKDGLDFSVRWGTKIFRAFSNKKKK